MRTLLLALVLLPGCLFRVDPAENLHGRRSLKTDVGAFEMTFAEGDASSTSLEQAIQAAAPKLRRWGTLSQPVRVIVVPTHERLEAAVNRGGYDWLRAWARYDEVLVQSPRTWGAGAARQKDVDELLLHELTHCLMYQRAATREDWRKREIPLWFREGMASVTAEQTYRWGALEDLAQFYAANRQQDPVTDPESLYQDQNHVVYGAAHHAFAFLLQRYGEERIQRLLEEMKQGAVFPAAFQKAFGISVDGFLDDFKRYVRLRGFKKSADRAAPQRTRSARAIEREMLAAPFP